MPYPRATLTQRRDQAMQDIAAARIYDSTTGSVVDATVLQNSALMVLAYMAAGAAYEEDGYIDWVVLQATPWTATEDGTATAWAALKGITRKPAAAATTSRALSGPPGTIIPVGTNFSRPDGFAYATTADAALDATGSATVQLLATVPGAQGNAPSGTALQPTLTFPGMTVLQSGPTATGGADIEAFADFRARYLLAYSQPPQGGAASDYVAWALAVPGVTRAWVNPNGAGAGTVVVYVMRDSANATAIPTTNGFPVGTNGVAGAETRDTPATGDQLTTANAIYPLRPVTSLVYVAAPLPALVPFAIHTTAQVSLAVRALVAAAIDAVFLALGSPLGGELEASPFEVAIGAVPGMPPFSLTLPPIQAPLGYLPVRGLVSYA